ncbi:hypothetical protein SK128_024644 [Halocaridina rubra]|uniref:4-coumarate--CoA ligase n=1 Tax=Halocaridina rubra TaxID=373956 RepID=A0AAN9A0K7_HALRR
MLLRCKTMAPLWNIARKAVTRKTPVIRLSTNALSGTERVRLQSTYIVKSEVPDLELPSGNLIHTVFEKASQFGSKTALECALSGRSYTYNQVLEGISKWAGFLTTLGIKKGDVIAINMPNSPEYPIVLFGSSSVGVIVTPVNPRYTAEELVRQLKDSGAKLLVGDASVEGAILDGLKEYKTPLHVIMNGTSRVPGALNLTDILNDATIPYMDAMQVNAKDIAMMPYSSGTTGLPKGVALSHGALSSNVKMLMHEHFCRAKDSTDTKQLAFATILPFYHVSGLLIQLMIGLAKGTKLLTMPAFEPNTYINCISKNKVEYLHLVPPLLNFLIHSPLATAETLSSVTTIGIGAAPVSPSATQALKKKLQRDVFLQEMYGMTEVLGTNSVPANEERIGTSGKLLPNVMAKIVDTLTGELIPSTSKGELCVKTPSMMTSYLNNEEATADTIDSEGWLHTGDVGYFDEDGFLKIVDRSKELIKVKGLQVSPSELEDIIRQHEQVLDVGVLGVPDDRSGEVPRAYVVTKNKILEKDIHSFIDTRVAPHKKLTGGVVFIDQLPKTPTGKLLRRELKKLAMG